MLWQAVAVAVAVEVAVAVAVAVAVVVVVLAVLVTGTMGIALVDTHPGDADAGVRATYGAHHAHNFRTTPSQIPLPVHKLHKEKIVLRNQGRIL